MAYPYTEYKFVVRFYTKNVSYEDHTVHPVYSSISKKWAKESNQMFFRCTLDGDIKLEGDDYTLMNSALLEQAMYFMIYRKNKTTGNYDEYFTAGMNKTTCEFDKDKKICKLGFTDYDNYSDILNNYEDTYDLLKLKCATTKVKMAIRPMIQFYELGASEITNCCGGSYWEYTIQTSIDDKGIMTGITKDSNGLYYHFSDLLCMPELTIETTSGTTKPAVAGCYAVDRPVYIQQPILSYPNYTNGASTYYISLVYSASGTVLWMYLTDEAYFAPASLGRPTTAELAHIFYQKKWDHGVDLGDMDHLFKEIFADDFTMANPSNSADTVNVTNGLIHHIYARVAYRSDIYDRFAYRSDTAPDSSTIWEIEEGDNFVSSQDTNNYNTYRKVTEDYKLFGTAYTLTENQSFGMNDLGGYFSANQLVKTYAQIERPIPLCQSSWGNCSMWFSYTSAVLSGMEGNNYKYYLRDALYVADVIKAFLGKYATSITHEATTDYSQFLYDTVDKLGYDKFYVFITQKSNVLKGNYDQAAATAKLTFKSFLDMLASCFKLYWFVDDSKRFRLEHISWFANGGSYSADNHAVTSDLTTLKDKFNKVSYAFFQNYVKYDSSNLFHRIEFEWGDKSSGPFSDIYINVTSTYVDPSLTTTVSVSDFCSDVDYMLSSPSSFSSDGFALLCPVKNSDGDYEVPIIYVSLVDSDQNIPYKAYVQNMYATWAHLLWYYLYDMSGYTAEFTNSDNTMVVQGTIAVQAIKKFMTQEVEYKSDSDPDTNGYIKTGIGNGEIESMSLDIDSRVVKATLLFTPT